MYLFLVAISLGRVTKGLNSYKPKTYEKLHCKGEPYRFVTDRKSSGVCRICNNTLLPNPNQTVTFTNGRVAYCASVEQDLNTLETVDAGIKCEDQQQKYKKACKCDSGIQFPANPPTPVLSDANRRQTHNKIQVAFMGILTVLTFEALFI